MCKVLMELSLADELYVSGDSRTLRYMVATEERRKRKRIALRWPVRLVRDAGVEAVESTTENLTSNGFYCVSKSPFQLGDRLDCVISIPSGGFGYGGSPVYLQCRVRITRVENQAEGFGLGCCIEDYDLLTNSDGATAGERPDAPL